MVLSIGAEINIRGVCKERSKDFCTGAAEDTQGQGQRGGGSHLGSDTAVGVQRCHQSGVIRPHVQGGEQDKDRRRNQSLGHNGEDEDVLDDVPVGSQEARNGCDNVAHAQDVGQGVGLHVADECLAGDSKAAEAATKVQGALWSGAATGYEKETPGHAGGQIAAAPWVNFVTHVQAGSVGSARTGNGVGGRSHCERLACDKGTAHTVAAGMQGAEGIDYVNADGNSKKDSSSSATDCQTNLHDDDILLNLGASLRNSQRNKKDKDTLDSVEGNLVDSHQGNGAKDKETPNSAEGCSRHPRDELLVPSPQRSNGEKVRENIEEPSEN